MPPARALPFASACALLALACNRDTSPSLARTTRTFDPVVLGEAGRAAYAALLEAPDYGGAFRGGCWSEFEDTREARCVYTLWDDPRGRDALVALTSRAATGGRLYALSALYASDPWAYRRIVAEFGDDTELVELGGGGCISADPLPVRDAVARHVATGSWPNELRGIWHRRRGPGRAK